jgi:thioredoxin reductase (NADPH)
MSEQINRDEAKSSNVSEQGSDGREESDILDCVILGAGPAGLTALEYLARFHRRAVALGASGPRPRLLFIERTYNLPGYPEGVPGKVLLNRLRQQAECSGGKVLDDTANHIDGEDGNFQVQLSSGKILRCRKIILAMGVRDRCPDIPHAEKHEGYFLRYCPVCDGYEHTDKTLGIVGSGETVARHALFLQTFSNRIHIFLHGESVETLGDYRDALKENGIMCYEPRITKILEGSREEGETEYSGRGVCLEDGSEIELAVLYGALGCELRLEPIAHLPINRDGDGYVLIDMNCETTLRGIYAAGDITSQINQISVAFGQATIAAVRVHNALDD